MDNLTDRRQETQETQALRLWFMNRRREVSSGAAIAKSILNSPHGQKDMFSATPAELAKNVLVVRSQEEAR